MPAWKGWNEGEVRHGRKSSQTATLEANPSSSTLGHDASSSTLGSEPSSSPVVMGFTAVNAPKANTRRQSKRAPSSNHNDHLPAQTKIRSQNVRPVASQYLGRDESDGEVPATKQPGRVTRSSANKKKANESKKRAATAANDQPASKRRKTSDVSDSMPVTKATSGKAKGKGKAVVGQRQNLPSNAIPNAPARAVPLYSSCTSMQNLTSSSQQTSLDAVKASQGYGTTLYHGSQAPTRKGSIVSRPWLGQQQPLKSHVEQTATPAVASSTTLDEDFIAGEDDDLEDAMALIDDTAVKPANENAKQFATSSQTIGRTQERRPPHREAKHATSSTAGASSTRPSSRTASEDFIIGDDEDMDDIVVLTRDPEANALAQTKKTQSSLRRKKSSDKASSTTVQHEIRSRTRVSKHVGKDQPAPDENFLVDDDDGPQIESAVEAVEAEQQQRGPTPPSRSWKQNMREVEENEYYGDALFSAAERKILDSIKGSQQRQHKPILRKRFPRPILDRSPLFGASSGTTLRTCFRIGESLKEGCQAVRSNKNIIIELYARVVSSRREGRKQHFVFHDLYHDRPPYLEGTCELWNQTKLWELDTRDFLGLDKTGKSVMCRTIARMKKKEGAEGTGWRLEVLSIWEAGWDDIDFVSGLYSKNGFEKGENEE